jgi:hypothetical protein
MMMLSSNNKQAEVHKIKIRRWLRLWSSIAYCLSLLLASRAIFLWCIRHFFFTSLGKIVVVDASRLLQMLLISRSTVPVPRLIYICIYDTAPREISKYLVCWASICFAKGKGDERVRNIVVNRTHQEW